MVARPPVHVHLELQKEALLGHRVFADIISEVVLGWGKPCRSDLVGQIYSRILVVSECKKTKNPEQWLSLVFASIWYFCM